MAIAFVQASAIKTASAVSSITSNLITSTAGNACFSAASIGAVNPAFGTPTGSDGTFTKRIEKIVGSLGVNIGEVLNISGGASRGFTQTLTSSGSGDAAAAYVEYSGVATSAANNGSNSNSGTSTTPTTGAVNPADAGSLYLIAECNAGSPTIAPDAGWNQRAENESGAGAQPLNLSDKVSSGSQNGGWTLGSSQAWVAVMATYKPPAATGTTVECAAFLPPSRAMQQNNVMY